MLDIKSEFNCETLLVHLEKEKERLLRLYIGYLFEDRYQDAADTLNLIDLVDVHINRVEEL